MKRKFAAAAFLIALVAAGVFYVAGRPKPVLQTARLFCVVPPWTGQQLAPSYNHYYWIANNTALIMPGARPNALSSLYRVTSDAAGHVGTPVPLGFALPATDGDDISVSPDGRLLAYIEPASGSETLPYRLVVRQADGSTRMRCVWNMDLESINQFAWAPDSQSLLTMQFRPEARLARVAINTGRIEEIPLPAELHLNVLEHGSILGFTAHGTVIIARKGSGFQDRAFFDAFGANAGATINVPGIPLVEISLSEHPEDVRTFAPAVPPGAGVGFVVLSPAGDRLFWGALSANKPSPLQVRLHRYLSFMPGDTTVVEKGWISRLDGREMKELGYYEIPPGTPSAANPAGPPWIIDPKWTPDGRRISFVYKDRLLTIPAE